MRIGDPFRIGIVVIAALSGATGRAEEASWEMTDHFLVKDGLRAWSTTDPPEAAPVWKLEADASLPGEATEPNHVLRVTGKSAYEPPVRSPHSIALLKGVRMGDFELTVRLKNTRPDAGPHRDLCIIFGYRDPSHFYYVHFGAVADPHACQIFVVDGGPRAKITRQEAAGTPWTDGWHTARVVRDVKRGTIVVFFDDLETPFMTAEDHRFPDGQVGLGTFDDHGQFDEFHLRGTRL